jgi:hypothetical protein
MPVLFEGFPRAVPASALKPGRWIVAADGLRPLLCFVTDLFEGDEQLAIAFDTPAVETLAVAAVPLSALGELLGTVEDEVIFAPGMMAGQPVLTAPARRALRNGVLVRLVSGDLGIVVHPRRSPEASVVSLTTGERAEGVDLVFERWSATLRRGAAETLLGQFKPTALFGERRRG